MNTVSPGNVLGATATGAFTVIVKRTVPAVVGVPVIARESVPPAGMFSPGIEPWTLLTTSDLLPVPPDAIIDPLYATPAVSGASGGAVSVTAGFTVTKMV